MTDPLNTPRSRLGVAFVLLARQWRQSLDRGLAEVGLTDATWVPLIHLNRQGGGIGQKDLAALLGIDASSLVRLLDILCGRGWVERRPDPADGRARLVHLTPEGERVVTGIRAELARREADFLQDLSDDEVVLFLDMLTRVQGRLDGLKAAGEAGA